MANVLLAAPCWAHFLLVVLIAWPIWHHAKEYALFQRRAVLASVALEGSAIRRWFWAGHFVGVLQALSALFWATILLLFAALLTASQWLILAVDAAIFAAMIPLVRRRLATEVRATHVAMVARRWPLLLGNVTLLTLAFFATDFFLTGAVDTRGLAWSQVAENAFAAYAGKSNCGIAGLAIGTGERCHGLAVARLAGSDSQPSRHRAQARGMDIGPAEGRCRGMGIHPMAARHECPDRSGGVPQAARRQPRGASHGLLLTVLAVAVPLAYLAVAFPEGAWPTMPRGARTVVAWANPCTGQAHAFEGLRPALRGAVEQARVQAARDADAAVDVTVKELFSGAEAQIEGYLDWYFSLLGEYQRLGAAVVTGDVAARMRLELERRVFGELLIEPRVNEAGRRIAGASIARFERLHSDLGAAVAEQAREKPCLPEIIDVAALRTLDRDRMRFSIAAGSGVVAGIATAMLARRAASAMISRVAAQRGYQAAGAVAGRIVTRRAGTMTIAATAATACAAGGPLAVLCALVAGAVSWVAIDYTLIKIDEARLRDEMRAEIAESVRATELRLATDLKEQQRALIGSLATAAEESVDRIFVPVRDGL